MPSTLVNSVKKTAGFPHRAITCLSTVSVTSSIGASIKMGLCNSFQKDAWFIARVLYHRVQALLHRIPCPGIPTGIAEGALPAAPTLSRTVKRHRSACAARRYIDGELDVAGLVKRAILHGVICAVQDACAAET